MQIKYDFTDLGYHLLKQLEALRLIAYQDPGGVWTIAYGHTGSDVVPGLVITEGHAEDLLAHDLAPIAAHLEAELQAVSISQNQFSALVILAYNIGLQAFDGSTVWRCLKNGEFSLIEDAWRLWIKIIDPVSKRLIVSPGLQFRREQELKLWNTPDQPRL